MKKQYIFTLLVAFLIVFGGCEDTNENLVGSRGIAVVPEMSEANPAFFTSDLENSYVAFTVNLPEGEAVDAAEVQITYEGKTVVIQEIESFPSDLNITATEVIAGLGISEADVEIGDSFLLHVVTTSAGVSTRSLAALLINVTCEFDPVLTGGSYHVVSADWEVEGDVTISVDPDDPFKLYIEDMAEMEGLVGNGNRLELNISPTSFKMSGPATVLSANLAPWGLSYTGYTYTPGVGLYNSCDGSFTMPFAISVDQGSFGTFNFTFTRNN